MAFLAAREPLSCSLSVPPGYGSAQLFIGEGEQALEVVVVSADARPSQKSLVALHEERKGKRATPVVVVVLHSTTRAALFTVLHQEAWGGADLEGGLVERVCDTALTSPDRHSAQRLLVDVLSQLDTPVPGLRNEGLFALHELMHGVPTRPDWAAAGEHARRAAALRGPALLDALGYRVQATTSQYSVLIAGDRRVAVAVYLERPDQIEPPSARFDGLSPVSYALAKADQENLDYVVVSAGASLRVYPVKPNVGTARRGRTETFVQLDLTLLSDKHASYLWLLASANALLTGGSFERILGDSADYAAELGRRLRQRVYEDVVPRLADAIVRARRLRNPTPERLAETYEMTLLVLFRLLFVAYAEDKDLLPLHSSAAYRKHSLKEIAKQLQAAHEAGTPFESQDYYWTEVTQLWKAVDSGNRGWKVPPYNGGMFASGQDARVAGRELAKLSLKDIDFAPALKGLLLEETSEGGLGPIDFRSLGVREFGTIYEGLLESELSVAECDLAVDAKSLAFRPARARDNVVVPDGRVYLHNASGARKATGAYYTKSFAVEYLLDQALEPALVDHLARLDALDERDAAKQFFAFHVADISMGSGHFLVAAVDRVERGLSNYLARRPLSAVRDELARLRASAEQQLGEALGPEDVEDARLLRRQIARRCIFGVDLNPLAVELARLSMWIHTFVPGLPLSFLDGNLVVGNSLVGIATFEEASELLEAGEQSLFGESALQRLDKARGPVEKLARLSEATAAEVKEARALYERIRAELESESMLFTVLTASRIDERASNFVQSGMAKLGNVNSDEDPFTDPKGAAFLQQSRRALDGLHALHFPLVFPQVFMSSRGGFDVIVGNPPWEEATLEEHAFWARNEPGLRGLSQVEQEARKRALRRQRPDLVAAFDKATEQAAAMRRLLTAGPFPGMGTGDPDLYKAFCWRFWSLASPRGGRLGVVLPRSAMSAKGASAFRSRVFGAAAEVQVTAVLNTAGWVFDEAEHRYTISLTAITRDELARDSRILLRGPYPSLARFREGVVGEPATFSAAEVSSWNDSASLPLLPSEDSARVFALLRKSPRLDADDAGQWRARPVSEFHATNDKPLMDLKSKECPAGFWPVFKGESFDLWTPDTGEGHYYAWADPKKVIPELQRKRVNSCARGGGSAFSEMPPAWIADERTLPCLKPRIAFRDISRATDTRTVRVALLPPQVVLTNTAPYFVWPRGEEQDEAYLLGVMSSTPLDWYARRFVETHLNFFVLNPFPIPRPPADHPLRAQVIECAGRLASQDRRLHAWGRTVGVQPRALELAEQEDLIHRLDAAVALLYGLEAADVSHIFETFHEGWDHRARLAATLQHFESMRSLA